MTTLREQAIRQHLESEYNATTEEVLRVTTDSNGNGSHFRFGQMEFEVLTDAEATRRAHEWIEESLWAFKPEFIASFSPVKDRATLAKALSLIQEKVCENANELVRALIGSKPNLRRFMNEAIQADGRAHFLNTYDGEEHEVKVDKKTFYVYRMN